MRDVRRGEPQTVREWPDRRGPGRGHDHERDRYQRGGRSDYDGRRDEGRVHSRTHARERDEAPPGDELLEKYEALLTAEEREVRTCMPLLLCTACHLHNDFDDRPQRAARAHWARA